MKKAAVIITAAILVIVVAVVFLLNNNEEITYQETTVISGRLSVGVTESGSLAVGTTVQSFDLDISEYSGESTYTWGMGGGMGGMNFAMPGTEAGNSGNDSASSDRQLLVEEVYVKDGQEIGQGEPLLKLTDESVNSIRTQLSEDVAAAQNVYDQMQTGGKQSRQEAEGELELNVLYGTYAQSEYSQSVTVAQNDVTLKEDTLTAAQEALAEAQADLAEKQTRLTAERQVLANAVYAVGATDRETDPYWWIIAVQTQTDAEAMVTELTEEIEALSEQIITDEKSVLQAETELELAKKQWETAMVQADTQLKKRNYQAENSQEIYDVAIAQSNFDEEKALADLSEAEEKLADFDAVIVEGIIYSTYRGLIMETIVAVNDVLNQDTELIELNDYDAVTITLSIEEEDMAAAGLGGQANITIAAFPDQIFQGTVTEIGDAIIDSNTNKTLTDVTVTLAGTADILYQDMTAEVTFITEESAEVLYIPNKAIVQEGEKSYVKVREESGKIVTKEVAVGFTDGINTEIIQGLSEGETVVWERQVTGR